MQFKVMTAAVAGALIAMGAQAASYDYSGDTTGAPTYHRALAGFGGLSGVGTDVAYDSFAFSVTADGAYDFLSVADGWDNFLFLYSPSFDPGAALSNGVASNDDFGGIGSSGFTAALSTGTAYVLVTTGFGNDDLGAYMNSINGPGSVVAVPEPATYGMMALGLLAVGGLAHRRQAAART